jgi:xanthine dehydrogenase accessory factor
MSRTDLLAHAEELRAGRTPFVFATVVRAQRPTSAKPGDCALVLADGTLEGFVGGTCAESTVRLQGLRLLGTGSSTLLRITPHSGEQLVEEGVVTVGNPCLSGGTLEIFLEAELPPVLVRVFGDAPVARALVSVGKALGYDVVAGGDPREPLPEDVDAVIVASHGRDEEAVLRSSLDARVDYIGLVASTKRGSAVLAGLGVDAETSALVHTPAGLDIGARTPTEIALSIYAEIVGSRPRPPSRPPESVDAPAEAVDPICGMSVAVTSDGSRHSHGGRVFYFCGPGCRQAFADDPGRYVADE